jgi:hypothetical protein
MKPRNILEPRITFQRVKAQEGSGSHYASPLSFEILHAVGFYLAKTLNRELLASILKRMRRSFECCN